MRQHMLELLNLQGFWVDGFTVEPAQLIVKLRSPRQTALCQRCGQWSRRIHQIHARRVKHTRWGQRLVGLVITRRRFWCRACGRPFTEALPGIDRQRSTPAYRDSLVEALRRQSFSYVVEKTQSSPNVLYRVLHKATAAPINWAAQGSGLTIGLDEHSYRGRHLVTGLTNITAKKLLGLGTGDSQAELRRLLQGAEQADIVEVCMDMRLGYRTVVEELLPHTRIVADKYHVIAAANRVVDELRRIIVNDRRHCRRLLLTGRERLRPDQREKLEKLFRDYRPFPTLYQSYLVKEKVRMMYGAARRTEAARRLEDIIMLCETGDTRYLKTFGRTLRLWREQILNHFDRRSTNAFTEGVNTKIKMIKRMSFGFRNVHHYIAKVMLAFLPLAVALATLNHHTV